MKNSLVVLFALLLLGCRPTPPEAEPTSPPPSPTLPSPPSPPSPSPPTTSPSMPTVTPSPNLLSSGSISGVILPSRASPKGNGRASLSDLPLELPAPATPRKISDPQLADLKALALQTGSAADWRKVAERAVKVEDFTLAHQAFSKESAIYKQKGFAQAAIAEGVKAAQYGTELRTYRSVPASKPARLERMEPADGCYVGAFIDRDDQLNKHTFASQIHGDIPQFNELVGKPHASFFMYRAYGQPFPIEWARYVKEQGAVPHIAWEPRNLKQVADDSYLSDFMAQAASLNHPVILRFAAEMNGDWTGYNGDPEGYKKAFRLVYAASRSAPKVAMMWCPNAVPQSGIEDYYPGDDYVDWVGVNFYSVPFLDNNPDRPGEKIHPTDHLKYVYDTYAKRKPIAVGEWAASQKSVLSERSKIEFAHGKLAQLYAALPTRYPRVKMVNWYDCNNIIQAKDERQLNNFQVTTPDQLLQAYKRAVSDPYYLGAGEKTSARRYEENKEQKVVLGKSDEIKIFLKSYDPTLRVFFQVDGQVVHASDDPLEWFLAAGQLPSKPKGPLKVLVYDSANRFVTSATLAYQTK